jgi:hypothetical protein
MSEVELTFIVLGGIGSFLSGIIVLITFLRVITKLQLKDEVIYGKEADDQYKEFAKKEHKGDKEILPYEYEGGKNKIIPRLEIEKFVYNSVIMEKELKKYKKRVRYFYNEGEKRYVKIWYLK